MAVATVRYIGVKKAVEKVVLDVKSKVIVEFDAYVKEHVDEESYEAMKELFEGFQKQLAALVLKLDETDPATAKASAGSQKKGQKVATSEPKPKKALSPYNIFIKETIESIKRDHPEMKGQELMKAATEAWKAKKAAATV